MASSIDYIPAGQLNFPHMENGRQLRADIDNAGQTVLIPMNGMPHTIAMETLKDVMSAAPQRTMENDIKSVVDKLWRYHHDAFTKTSGATGASSYPKQEMRTYLSLIHALQPDKDALMKAGVAEGMAKAIGDYCSANKGNIERGLTELGLGEPMMLAELKQEVPTFLAPLSQGNGAGVA